MKLYQLHPQHVDKMNIVCSMPADFEPLDIIETWVLEKSGDLK